MQPLLHTDFPRDGLARRRTIVVTRPATHASRDTLTVMHAVRGAWNLFLLGLATRFRLRGRYWSWRNETAFGADRAAWPSAAERRRAALEYGAWVGRMRALARERRREGVRPG